MKRKVIKVGIITREDYKKRTIAIAKGEYIPKHGEPKIWFESIQTLAQVLSSENQDLLKIIIAEQPDSLEELEKVTGRQRQNLSEVLETMARYGIVELMRHNSSIKPIVKATDFKVEFGIHQPFEK